MVDLVYYLPNLLFFDIQLLCSEAATRGVPQKNVFLEISQIAGQTCNFIKKETPAQLFSWEFCEISKNTFSTEHLWKTASVYYYINLRSSIILFFFWRHVSFFRYFFTMFICNCFLFVLLWTFEIFYILLEVLLPIKS